MSWRQQAADWWTRNERRLSSVALLVGFIIDNLTISRVPLKVVYLGLLTYLGIAAVCIIILNWLENTPARRGFKAKLHAFSLIMLQLNFGALFSGFLAFYSRGSIAASWPFLLILLILLVGNEFLRERYARISFQITFLFIGVFTYAIFFTPIVTKSISDWVFVLSGLCSLVFIYLFIRLIRVISPDRFAESRFLTFGGIAFSFLAVNALYFQNLIPPLPLTLKEAAIFHAVARRANGDYVVMTEVKKWSDRFRLRERVRVREEGSPLYFWSTVFAPTDLETTVIHNWQKWTEEQGWVSVFETAFPIKGGRAGGYRGYSLKERVNPGLWRVEVKTARGGVIGRKSFWAEAGSESLELKQVIK